jgi:YVTN family beta-propeller protein
LRVLCDLVASGRDFNAKTVMSMEIREREIDLMLGCCEGVNISSPVLFRLFPRSRVGAGSVAFLSVVLSLLLVGSSFPTISLAASASTQTNVVVATVPVGSFPIGVAFDSANGYVYVANYNSWTVSVIDGSTNTVQATVPVGSYPNRVAFDSMNENVYVTNTGSDAVSVINGSTNKVVLNITVGSGPVGVAFDSANGNIYVANTGSNTVSVIDGSANTVVSTIPVNSGPVGAAFDPANDNIYVASYGSSAISVVNGTTNKVVETIPVSSHSYGLVYDSTNGDIYATNYGSDAVSVIDVVTQTVGITVPVGSNPLGIAFDPANGNIYVANTGSNTVSVIAGSVQPIPSGILSYVPITITNSRPSPTSAPFQQRITVNSLTYSSFEAFNLQNVEFFDSKGLVIPSWLESGNFRTAPKTIYWLSLSKGIPADSSVTVYMGFANPTTNLFNSQTTGEAPELSPIYAQYDTGSRVFPFYDNFAVNSPNSAWSVSLSLGASYSRTNGLHVTFPQESAGYYVTKQSFSFNTTFDAKVLQLRNYDDVGYINTNQQIFWGGADSGNWAGAFIRFACNGTFPDQWNQAGEANPCGGSYGSLASGSSAFGVYTVSLVSKTSSVQALGYSQGATSQPISLYPPTYPASAGLMGTNGTASIQWARVRASPPNGIMPVATFGALVSTATVVACTPTPGTVGAHVTCTATVRGSPTPTGTMVWSTSGIGAFSRPSCRLTGGSCKVTYTPKLAAGSIIITASYAGDKLNPPSFGAFTLALTQMTSTTRVVCKPTTLVVGSSTTAKCTAIVKGYLPSGAITWSQSGTGSLAFTSDSCILTKGSCSVTLRALSAGTVYVQGTYSGDTNNQDSSASAKLTLK